MDDEESKKQMLELSLNEAVRREWIVSTGARIANIFDHFPTLSTIHRADKSLGIAMLESILLKLPKLRARYYSVSSSPQKEGNNKFSLTVGRVTWRGGYNKRMYLGFCSDFLATLPLETNVVVEMRPAPSFRLPRAPETPILMVAGGTGIAPFKGFVDHLTVNKAGTTQGDAWLIVGCQTKNNQLYRHELETAAENKVLTKYLVGYSRESTEPKRYIDVVMRENADGIRDLIARGGHVYVCGDIRIEESVRKALVDILGNGDAVKVKDLLPISPDTGTAALAQLEKEHKIHLDIFGAFDVQGMQKKQLEAALTKIKEIKVKNDP